MSLTLNKAAAIIDVALTKSEELGTLMNIAVVDETGVLRAFARQDGAWLGSVDIAQRKANTAWLFNMPTGVLGTLSQPGGSLWGIEHSNGGLITFPGGVPIVEDGITIGAIGVSGDTVENDEAVATAGADLLFSPASVQY